MNLGQAEAWTASNRDATPNFRLHFSQPKSTKLTVVSDFSWMVPCRQYLAGQSPLSRIRDRHVAPPLCTGSRDRSSSNLFDAFNGVTPLSPCFHKYPRGGSTEVKGDVMLRRANPISCRPPVECWYAWQRACACACACARVYVYMLERAWMRAWARVCLINYTFYIE